MSDFATVYRTLSGDWLMFAILYGGLVCLCLSVFYWKDPVSCTMHHKYTHKLLSSVFFLASISYFDRFWNRGLELYRAGALPTASILDTEIILAIALTVLLFVTGYDHFKVKTTMEVWEKKSDHYDPPCGGCKLKHPR